MLVGRAWRCNRGRRGRHGATFCRRAEPATVGLAGNRRRKIFGCRRLRNPAPLGWKSAGFFRLPGLGSMRSGIWSAVSRRQRRGFGAWMVSSIVRRICACNFVVLAALALGGLLASPDNVKAQLAPSSITIVKSAVGGDGVFSFTSSLTNFTLSTANGTASRTFANLPPGNYSFTETGLPPEWQLTSLTCTAAVCRPLSISVAAPRMSASMPAKRSPAHSLIRSTRRNTARKPSRSSAVFSRIAFHC